MAGAASAAAADAAPAAVVSGAVAGAPALAAGVAEVVAVEVRIPWCQPRITAVIRIVGSRPAGAAATAIRKVASGAGLCIAALLTLPCSR